MARSMSLSTGQCAIDPGAVALGASGPFVTSGVCRTSILGEPDRVSLIEAYAPPTRPSYPADRSYTSYPSYPSNSDDDANGRRGRRGRRGHHPLRALARLIADIFIILWALLNTIENWPQEWSAIKETLVFVYVFVLWVLHHFGLAMALTMLTMR